MAKKAYKKFRMAEYKSELFVFFLCMSAIFLFFALCSYNPEDSSWFHYSSYPAVITNWSGMLGAHSAALLFYFFGGASFLLVALLLFIAYVTLRNVWRYEWERLLFACASIPIIAVILRLHMVDVPLSPLPGGVVGSLLYSNIYRFFGSLGGALLLYACLLILFFMITRFSFMQFFYAVFFVVRYLASKRHIAIYAYEIVHQIVMVVLVRPLIACGKFIGSLLDGTAFEQTELLAPRMSDMSEELLSFEGLRYTASLSDSDRSVPDTQEMQEIDKQDLMSLASVVHEKQEQVTSADKSEVETESSESSSVTKLGYELPNVNMFIASKSERHDETIKKELEMRAHILQEKLERFGITGKVVGIKRGPIVTLFEYKPTIDTKISRI